MSRLTKRLEILFPEDLAEYLKQLAEREGCSVGTLVREAVLEKYTATSRQEKMAAAERLCALEAPCGDWEDIENEIIAGALE